VTQHQLEPGMVLARDLVGDNGALLLTADLTLSPQLISQIQNLAARHGIELSLPLRVGV